MFKGLEDEADEDLEISQMVEEYEKQGGTILGEYSCLSYSTFRVITAGGHFVQFLLNTQD